MAEVLTPEEIATLKANPATAALGEKLEKEASKWMPRGVFNEVNEEAKKYKAELERIQSERSAAEKRALEEQGKFKELADKRAAELAEIAKNLEAEKSVAEKYRKMEADKRDSLKKTLGDKWLSVYDNATYDDLVKLEGTITPQSTPDGHRSGSKVTPKDWKDMTPQERETMIHLAKAGKLK